MSNLTQCEKDLGWCEEAQTYCSIAEDVYEQIRVDAIDEFAHILKETFNNEFPSNYHCTQPYFTLDNVSVLTDAVAKELKGQK